MLCWVDFIFEFYRLFFSSQLVLPYFIWICLSHHWFRLSDFVNTPIRLVLFHRHPHYLILPKTNLSMFLSVPLKPTQSLSPFLVPLLSILSPELSCGSSDHQIMLQWYGKRLCRNWLFWFVGSKMTNFICRGTQSPGRQFSLAFSYRIARKGEELIIKYKIPKYLKT